jgi:hypothetical protein
VLSWFDDVLFQDKRYSASGGIMMYALAVKVPSLTADRRSSNAGNGSEETDSSF